MTKLIIPQRKIRGLIIHCTATMPGRDFRAADIQAWHMARGWTDNGYHFVNCRDGIIEPGRDLEKDGAHARRWNKGTIGLAMVGGLGRDMNPAPDFTQAQWRSLRRFIKDFQKLFPGAFIVGHRDTGAKKACPSFDVAAFVKSGRVAA